MLETFAIFGAVNRIRRRADDRHTEFFQARDELERGLAAELHDDALRFFEPHDLEHVFERHRLEVQPVRHVEVGRHGLRVAVDHDRFEAVLAHRQRGVHAAVVEFDALPDTVGTAAEHDDLVAARRFRFAFLVVARVHVGGTGAEFGGAGIDALVHGMNIHRMTQIAYRRFGHTEHLGDAHVRETLALQAEQIVAIEMTQRQARQHFFLFDDVLDLHQEPGIDPGELMHLIERQVAAERVRDITDAVGAGILQFVAELLVRVARVLVEDRIEAADADLETAQRLLQRLLERAADCHHLADRLHLRRQAILRLRKLFEGETRNLRNHVIDARLERSRRDAAGD